MNSDIKNTIKLAVIGHTNAGKTSLLRTLTRDRNFGEVSIHPATTRHVEAITLEVDNVLHVEFEDTPGFEDSIGLLNLLHQQESDPRLTGPVRLNHFLNTEPARGDFKQEAKAIRQLLKSDISLYVADAREPVTGKYRDEFVILGWSGKPCLVVLNFVAGAVDSDCWRVALADAGLHNVVEFDTVVFDPDDERRLLNQLALLLPAAEQHVQRLLALRNAERSQQLDNAAVLIASTLVDCAVIHDNSGNALENVQQQAREREKRLNRDLLELFRFTEADYLADDLPVDGDLWDLDLFDPQVLSELGISLGSSAAKGAAAGAAIDLVTGFTSLGAATLIGGIIGSGIDTVNRLKKFMDSGDSEKETALVSIESLCYLSRRACLLVRYLCARGHAAVHPLSLQQDLKKPLEKEDQIIEILQKNRYLPEWASRRDDSRTSLAVRPLIGLLRQNLPEE